MAKYHDIYQELQSRIRTNIYPANSYLPSENELMVEFGASRDTVRKSLNLLLEKGYILKEKGKGSKVLDQEVVTFPASGLISFKELKKNSPLEIETDVVYCESVLDSYGQKHLNLGADEPVMLVVRVRKYNGERVILDVDYYNPKIIPGINKEIAADSLYEYIENTLHLSIGFAKKEITVEPANQKEKNLLDLQDSNLLAVVRSHTFLEDATLFQYSISKHRPDKFRFLDFAKREKL